jgi:hypothetical protein
MSASSPPDNLRKISIMIAGAQKAGTTSLKNYLGQHPALQTHHHKEFAYFVDDHAFADGYAAAKRKYFHPTKANVELIAKSAGLYISEKALRRLRDHNPDCKLIVILRNPVERTYSSYLMERNYGAIHEPFEIIKDIIRKSDRTDWRYEFFIGMSLYCKQLELMYRYFPKENVRIVRFEELADDPQKVCKNIFEWVGADRNFTPDTSVRHNVTTVTRSQTYGKILLRMLKNSSPLKKAARALLPGKMDYKVGEAMRKINHTDKKYEPIAQATLNELIEFFRPYNDELSKMTGTDFSSWNSTKEKS